MENAANALLIAGGILLAILTLSLFAYMFNNMAIMQNAKADKEKVEELSNWNQQWEAYEKQYLYGLEVLTVINKADNNNKQYSNSPEYTVKIIVDGIEANENASIRASLQTAEKTTIYKCIHTETEKNDYGRICKMVFEKE